MTATKTEPSHSKKKLLMLAGVCGIAAAIVSLVFTSLAISYSPSFSLTQNWLSDLTGLSYASFLNVSRPVVNSPTTEILIRSEFIIGGLLGIVFSLGLFYDGSATSHRLGAVLAILGAGALSAVGIFPEPIAVPHLVVSYALFLLILTAMLLIGGALVDVPHKRLGGLSIALGILALIGTSFVSYGRGVAQLAFMLAIAVWIVIYSVRMLWHPALQPLILALRRVSQII